jgi:hypothetical protein
MRRVHRPGIGQGVGMRTLTALIVLVACCASASSISAGTSGKAYLRVVDRDPLTVQGRAFKSRERVRVVASVPESAETMASGSEIARKTVRATATGSFRVVFSEMSVDRCSLVRVTSVGARGSMAVLKVLPSPMCTPSHSP